MSDENVTINSMYIHVISKHVLIQHRSDIMISNREGVRFFNCLATIKFTASISPFHTYEYAFVHIEEKTVIYGRTRNPSASPKYENGRSFIQDRS